MSFCLDILGINTLYNINKMASEESEDPLKIKMTEYLKENFVDANKLGVSTVEGFYTYPNPAYKDDDFLT
jgi:3-hydroxybutyryl-CoA dehydrogenase|tara:strand:+ start:14086 stop:14295 length:210 start_codon:yes stop_codon:yes gene_type:complete